jgi:hypothetical protein
MHLSRLSEAGLDMTNVLTAHPDDLERVLKETEADRVIITSPDYTHAELIVRSLDAGVDTVVEKPLTINPESTRQIAEAVERTGRQVVVTHNYRTRHGIRQEVDQGRLDRYAAVGHVEWVLTPRTGGLPSRWHRNKIAWWPADPQGLHHFDFVNWWPVTRPAGVRSRRRAVYVSENAAAREWRRIPSGVRMKEHTVRGTDLRSDPRLKALYLDAEAYDGYQRDQDVFGPGVTTVDNLAVIVDYARDVTLSYAPNAHAPGRATGWSSTATKGVPSSRSSNALLCHHADGKFVVDPSVIPESSSVPAANSRATATPLRWPRHHDRRRRWSHGGGDALLLADIFRGPGDDWLERPADWLAGIRQRWSGCNESLRTARWSRSPILICRFLLRTSLALDPERACLSRQEA